MASVFIIIAGIRNLAFILNPILLSLVITITLLPLPSWFAKRGIPGWLSLVLTFLVVLAVIGLILLMIFFGMAQLNEVIPTLRLTAASSTVTNAQSEVMGVQIGTVTQTIDDFVTSQRFTGVATTVISALFVGLSQAFLVMLIFAFMLSSALALPSSVRLGLRTDHPLIKQVAALTEDVRRYITLTTVCLLYTSPSPRD